MLTLHVYSSTDIANQQRRIRKLLQEFPELWAFSKDWGADQEKRVRIHRAPAIGFLKGGIHPSVPQNSLAVYFVTSHPSIEELEGTFCGNQIIADPDHDDIDTREAIYVALRMRGDQIRYIVLRESGDDSADWRLDIIKPPRGHSNFVHYVQEIKRYRQELA